jgi:hypothetical protein
VEKPCQKIGALIGAPLRTMGSARISLARQRTMEPGSRWNSHWNQRATWRNSYPPHKCCSYGPVDRLVAHGSMRSLVSPPSKLMPSFPTSPTIRGAPPSDSPVTLSELGPAPPWKSRADQVSPLAQVSPIRTEPLALLYNHGAWLHKRQRLPPAGP